MGDFPSILKELRALHNMTQDDLARKLDVTKGSISNYESGIRQPSFAMEEAIADLFNVDLDYLRGRSSTQRMHQLTDDEYPIDELEALREELKNTPGMRTLFSLAKNATPEDLKLVEDMLKRMKKDSGFDGPED